VCVVQSKNANTSSWQSTAHPAGAAHIARPFAVPALPADPPHRDLPDPGHVLAALHAAITRPVTVGSATAAFAARLALLPTASSTHGSSPPRPPDRESASSVVDAATIIPSTDSGVSAATHLGWPCNATRACMCRYDTVPAISASNVTHQILVRLIHRSARPVTPDSRKPAHR